MAPKYKRMIMIALALVMIATGVGIILKQFEDNIVFFYSPNEIKGKALTNKVIRIGGLVKEGSIKDLSNLEYEFVLTDFKSEIKVKYHGILPNLFRENQGIVAKGKIENEAFIASELLAKHDENYMPKEVADTLKKSGKWKEQK